jgi:hypothetical protein
MFYILYFLSTLLSAPTKVTCTCVPFYDSLGNVVRGNYDLIFKGRVEKIDSIFYVPQAFLGSTSPNDSSAISTRDSGGYAQGITVLLSVNNVFKGNKTTQKIRIMTGIGGGDCGYYFQAGKSYIVYANKQPYILIDSFKGENRDSFKSHDEVLFETDDCKGTTDQIAREEAILRKEFKEPPQ